MLNSDHCRLCKKKESCVTLCQDVRVDLYRHGGGRKKKPKLIFESQLDMNMHAKWINRVYAGSYGD